jgi:ribosomal protein S12 methylthiotransferase
MLARLVLSGMVVCGDVADADAVIVATCSFIEDARTETAGIIREMLELKKHGFIKAVIVTGCMVEHFGKSLEKPLPGVDAFVGFGSFPRIAGIVRRAVAGAGPHTRKPALPKKLGYEGERLRITPAHYAYLRVTEGCNNRCSYCAIPSIRGPLRSKPEAAVLREARELASHGARELILIGEDTTVYGRDLPGRPTLARLIRKLSEIDGVEWIRLLYAYPSHVDGKLVKLFEFPEFKLLPYLDLPVQHASTPVLKRMGRRYDEVKLRKVIEKLRSANPEMVLRTSVITGFPGETERDFKTLLGFIEQGWFQRVGCFAYSDEQGTRAHGLAGKVPRRVALERRRAIMAAAKNVLIGFHGSLKGRHVPVILDTELQNDKYDFIGRTFADAPDIDSVIFLKGGSGLKTGEIRTAKVTGRRGYDIYGKLD